MFRFGPVNFCVESLIDDDMIRHAHSGHTDKEAAVFRCGYVDCFVESLIDGRIDWLID